jgi:Sec-independent protein translocase protein TatA
MDMAIIAVVILALFGAKTLQSVAHNTGKTVAQVKGAKDKVMSDLGVDDLKKAAENLPRIPLNPQQAVKQYILSDINEKKIPSSEKVSVPASENSNPGMEG